MKGRNLRFCGHALHFDDIIIDGNLQELTFVAYFTEGERVLAVASLGRDPVVSHCSELMRLGKMPSASELRAGKVPICLVLNSLHRIIHCCLARCFLCPSLGHPHC